jgi:hypothetical protein
MITKAETISALEQMPNQERLEIIKVASGLVEQEPLTALAGFAVRVSGAALIMRPLYEHGGELTEMTDFNTDDFVEST